MSTAAMVPSLIDDTEFLAQLDAIDACDPAVDSEEHSGEIRAHRGPQSMSHEPRRERSLPFWEERMREGAAAFNEIDDPEPAACRQAFREPPPARADALQRSGRWRRGARLSRPPAHLR
jgi:hypothetical protein